MDIRRLIQQATVIDRNIEKRLARVKFQDTGIPSGWLYVLDNRPCIPDYDAPQRTEYEAGGSGDTAFERHKHDLTVKPWMPKINDTVLVLFLPVEDGDGFILGGI